jgi:hypothetical protein
VVERRPIKLISVSLGEPLPSLRVVADLRRRAGRVSINMHPMAFASWFGLLATALNLFPRRAARRGHISYAVLGRRSSGSLGMVLVAVGLASFSSSWIAWTVMIPLMLVLVGPRHPPTLDDYTLNSTRLWLALSRWPC